MTLLDKPFKATGKLSRGEANHLADLLDSGDYEQSSAWLRVRDTNGRERFCCIGVYGVNCDAVESHREADHNMGYTFWYKGDHQSCSTSFLPFAVLSEHLQTQLSVLNDMYLTFPQVANVLRHHFDARKQQLKPSVIDYIQSVFGPQTVTDAEVRKNLLLTP